MRCDERDAKHARVPLRPAEQPLRSVRTFSTNLRPALRAAACGGRPRAGSDPTVTGAPASPSTPGGTNLGRRRRKILPVSHRRRTGRRLIALPPGFLADLLGAIPASLTLILEPVLASPTTRTPKPPKRGLDPVQHDAPSYLLRLSHARCRMASHQSDSSPVTMTLTGVTRWPPPPGSELHRPAGMRDHAPSIGRQRSSTDNDGQSACP